MTGKNLLCNQHPACNVVSANEARWKRTGHLTSPGKPTFQPGLQCSLLRRASVGSSTPVTFLIISHRPGITWPIATSLQVMTVTFLWGHTREQQEGRHGGGVAWPTWSLKGDPRRCQIRWPPPPHSIPSPPHHLGLVSSKSASPAQPSSQGDAAMDLEPRACQKRGLFHVPASLHKESLSLGE